MPEEGGNKENPINHESNNEFSSWIKDKEKEKAEREKRIEKSFSKIDKHLKNFKKMSNSEKESNFQEGKNIQNSPEFKNWLVNKENFKNITDENLKTFIEFTGGIDPNYLTGSFLLSSIDKLQDLVSNGKIKKAEADKLIPRFHEQLRNVVEKDKKNKMNSEERFVESMTDAQRKAKTEQISLDLPKVNQKAPVLEKERQTENQRAYVRYFLDSIENSNRDSHDFAISYITNALEASLDKMETSVRNEVEARLSLHDCAELVRQANGWIQRPKGMSGMTIGDASSEALRRDHELDRKKIETLLRKYNRENKIGMPGLIVGRAWDLLQELNNEENYEDRVLKTNKKIQRMNEERRKKKLAKLPELSTKDLLSEARFKNKNGVGFYTDTDLKRKEIIRQEVIREKLGENDLAKKSFQLAEKLTIATLETSVFNRNQGIGNDELGDIIGLNRWREGRRKAGRDRGPEFHEKDIKGFGSSYIRFMIKKEGFKDNKNELKTNDILENLEGFAEGSYSYFCAVKLGRIYALNGLLLERSPEPFSINKSSLQKAVTYFDLVDKGLLTEEEKSRLKIRYEEELKDTVRQDKLEEEVEKKIKQYEAKYVKYGDKKLRLLWIGGVVDLALGNYYLKWDAAAFAELRKAVVQEELSPEKGTFLGLDQWNWILKATDFRSRFNTLAAFRFKAEYRPKI